MAARNLPNLGLKAFFALGEDGWNDEVDSNFLKLSTLVQGGVLSVITTRPASPAQNDVYLMAAGASSNPNHIAVYDGGEWKHFAPVKGWSVYNRATDAYLIYSGTAWQSMPVAKLITLANLDGTAGIVEQTGAATFAKRAIGTTSADSLLTRFAGDARYAVLAHTHPETGVAAFNGREGAVTLMGADVIGALSYTPQPQHTLLTALSGLNAMAGLIEQTGTNTFAKRSVGVASATDILTRGLADNRYLVQAPALIGLSAVNPNHLGLVEQHGQHSFRIRSIDGNDPNSLISRATVVSLVNDSLSSYRYGTTFTGKSRHQLVVNETEDGIALKAPGQVHIRTTASAAVTLALSDAGSHIRFTNASEVTVPPHGAVPFPVGTTISLIQAGDGQVALKATVGLYIDVMDGFMRKTMAKNGVIQLVKYANNRWTLFGAIAPGEDDDLEPYIFSADSDNVTVDNLAVTADTV
jgi:hypothetical protein